MLQAVNIKNVKFYIWLPVKVGYLPGIKNVGILQAVNIQM
jgi:hypothetical protein